LYLQDELRFFGEKLRLTLAGRYTSAKDSDPYSGQGKAEKVTPRVGLSFSLDKNTSLYGVWDEAFIPQAGVNFSGRSFDPITGNNIEVGLKKEWLNGLWTASVSSYQITKNNVLTADPDHQFYSLQLGQTQTRGVEFDLRGQILQGLDLTLNYAYTDGKVTKDTDPEQVGAQIPGSSKNIANAWVSYRFSNGFADGLGISCGVQYAGDRSNWYGAYSKNSELMPDYTRLDGAISYQLEKFGIALNINNLLSKYLYSGAHYSWGNFYYWQAEPERNFRLTINYKF
jgi:iron complex outermembrane receptor protein